MEWDDIRFFHAVAEAGSLSRAARRLNVSQPTVGRRIRILEDRLEAQLFHRLASGFVLTDAGQCIYEKAVEMAGAARCISDRVSGTRSRAEGRICLTTAEGLGQSWLVPKLMSLSRSHPDLEVNLTLSNIKLDIAGGEADLALRMGDPLDENLVGRQIGAVPFQLYASPGYLETFGTPTALGDLGAHRIIEWGGAISNVPQARHLREIGASAQPSVTLDSIYAQKAAAEAGMGLAALPPYLAEGAPDLQRVLADRFCVFVPVWLLTRADLRHTIRVGVVRAFLADAAREGFGLPPASPPVRRPGAAEGPLHAVAS